MRTLVCTSCYTLRRPSAKANRNQRFFFSVATSKTSLSTPIVVEFDFLRRKSRQLQKPRLAPLGRADVGRTAPHGRLARAAAVAAVVVQVRSAPVGRERARHDGFGRAQQIRANLRGRSRCRRHRLQQRARREAHAPLPGAVQAFARADGERDEDRQPQQQLQHRLHHVCEGAACPPCPASPRRGMRASPRSASPRPPLSRHSISTARPRVQAMLLIRYVSGVSLLPDASPAVPSNYDHAPRCRSTPGRSPRARRAVSLAAFGRRTQNVLVGAHSSK